MSLVYHDFWLYLQRWGFFLFCLKLAESTAYIWFFVVECSIQVNSVNTENFLNITYVLAVGFFKQNSGENCFCSV